MTERRVTSTEEQPMLNSERYRRQAAEMRAKAERADDQVVRNGYLELASHYDFMADYFERVEKKTTPD
jgi:hypothetical protein